MGHWPGVSGNAINGVGEDAPRRPSPIYWRPPDTIPHGPLQRWFYQRTGDDPTLAEARQERQRAIDQPLVPVATDKADMTAEALTAAVKGAATECGADDVGVTPMWADYVFEGDDPPNYPWMIVIAVEQDYEAMKQAPSMRSLVEITRQYGRGILAAKGLANWLRRQGYDAFPYGGPMAGSFVLIPPAIEAGLGELGKHGSMIHRKFGSNFRLACVLTDAPLIADARQTFGADDFCLHCRVCVGRLSARGDPAGEDAGARRTALVRRLRQVPALFQRGDELRHLPRGLPVQPARRRRQSGDEARNETRPRRKMTRKRARPRCVRARSRKPSANRASRRQGPLRSDDRSRSGPRRRQL